MTSRASDAELLKHLCAVEPATPRRPRSITLFDAVGSVSDEGLHSDYLAWLLDPAGPLDDNWLLARVMTVVAPDIALATVPVVEREVWLDNGRLDIRVTWDTFQLVIENKVWSSEGDRQVARYLTGAGIDSPNDGRIVFLTPAGDWPRSVERGNPCVLAMSYATLAELIDSELSTRPHRAARGMVFAAEFRDCLHRVINFRPDMHQPPQVSDATRLYLANTRRLKRIQDDAVEEACDYVQWLTGETRRRLTPVLGSDLALHDGRYVKVFRKPNWKRGDIVFGVFLGFEVDPKRRPITDGKDGPWVGIGAWPSDDQESRTQMADCDRMARSLHQPVQVLWPRREDCTNPEGPMCLYRELSVVDGDLASWGERVLELMVQLAERLHDPLAAFARRGDGD